MSNNKQNLQRQKIIDFAMNDFKLFCKFFVKIKTKNMQIKPFIFNKEQEYIDRQIDSQIERQGFARVIIVKSRQVGITTYCSARLLHKTMYSFSKNSALIGNYSKVVENIRNNIKSYLENIEDGLKPSVEIDNSNKIKFKGLQSGIEFFTSGTDAVGRSNTIHFLHGTEVAYWQNDHKTLASLFNTIPNLKGTEIILESTSSGREGAFYKLIKQALNKEIDFEVLFLPWFWQESYKLSENEIKKLNLKADSKWLFYQKQHGLSNAQLFWAIKTNNLLANSSKKEGPSLVFRQEYPASLEDAILSYKEDSFISAESIKKINKNKAIATNISPQRLILGVDVARQGKDYSYIIDRTENSLGYFVNLKLKTTNLMELCKVIINLINKHNVYKVCIDIIGLGAGVYDRLAELGYEDLLVAVNVANKAKNKERFANQKAELWSFFKDFIENKAEFLVDDNLLTEQILATCCFYNSFGRLQVEGKQNIKSSLFSSPDGADAALITFADSYFSNIVVQNSN